MRNIPRMEGYFNTGKSVNVVHDGIRMKNKNLMIKSIDKIKAFEKIQQ